MKSLYEFVSRIGKSKGFGIQSPWAYDFINDVVMEDLPYYAYEDIDKDYPSKTENKKQKLYFRIKNFVHGKNFSVVDITDTTIDLIKDKALFNGEKGVIILENIYESKINKEKWAELRNSNFIGITFDLYCCAICFMPNGMYKQHYKLNF